MGLNQILQITDTGWDYLCISCMIYKVVVACKDMIFHDCVTKSHRLWLIYPNYLLLCNFVIELGQIFFLRTPPFFLFARANCSILVLFFPSPRVQFLITLVLLLTFYDLPSSACSAVYLSVPFMQFKLSSHPRLGL